MIEIETTNYDSPIYCMMCGTQTTDGLGSITRCPHLVYGGMKEGEPFSAYKTMALLLENRSVENPHDDEFVYDALLDIFRKNLDDEHLCIHVTVPAPSGATWSVIYNLGATDKDSGE